MFPYPLGSLVKSDSKKSRQERQVSLSFPSLLFSPHYNSVQRLASSSLRFPTPVGLSAKSSPMPALPASRDPHQRKSPHLYLLIKPRRAR